MTMLSIIACYSMYVAIPLLAVSLTVSPKDCLLGGKRLPRIRPKLWGYAALIALLAIDFAMIPRVNNPAYGLRFYASDVAVILVPLLFGMFTRQSIWDLWCLAVIVGLLGMLSLPAITAH